VVTDARVSLPKAGAGHHLPLNDSPAPPLDVPFHSATSCARGHRRKPIRHSVAFGINEAMRTATPSALCSTHSKSAFGGLIAAWRKPLSLAQM
jgi:hypothetical protein